MDIKSITPTYGGRWVDKPIPKTRIPENMLPPEAAYQIIRDELNLDGNPSLNLASFVTTWMEPEANTLALECLNKNFIDHDEYPQTEIIHRRIISMIANLYHIPEPPTDKDLEDPEYFIGTAAVGSSEAIMLALLAHKWNWKSQYPIKAQIRKPIIVMGGDVHTCWEKFALYFDVEIKWIDLKPGNYIVTAAEVEEKLLEPTDNMKVGDFTIAVGCVLGSTYTGQMDEIEKINHVLEKLNKKKGWDIPIHVDAASGGFVVPFNKKDPKHHPPLWDFRLSRVKSINTSNHKFGLVYPGMGTVVFRDKNVVPKELFFKIDYLGGSMYNYSLNFSRGSSTIILQYYNFLRLGERGYTKIVKNMINVTQYLETRLTRLKPTLFECVSDTKNFPVVALKVMDVDGKKAKYLAPQISDELRKFGWIVPAYALAAHPADDKGDHLLEPETWVLRVVVKENFSRDMADMFYENMKTVIKKLLSEKKEIREISARTTRHIC